MSNVILSLCSLLLLKEILRILPAPISHLSILKLLAELMTYFVPQRFKVQRLSEMLPSGGREKANCHSRKEG